MVQEFSADLMHLSVSLASSDARGQEAACRCLPAQDSPIAFQAVPPAVTANAENGWNRNGRFRAFRWRKRTLIQPKLCLLLRALCTSLLRGIGASVDRPQYPHPVESLFSLGFLNQRTPPSVHLYPPFGGACSRTC